MSVTKVAIAGMTGKFARLITTHLLNKPNVEINGFCRDPSKVPQEISSNPRVKIYKASSVETDKIREAIEGTDICICCYLGDESLMEDGQKQLIDACISEKVPRFMDSGYIFDYRSLELGAAPQKDFCKKIRTYLEQKSDQIQAVHVLNGAFMEVCFAPFYGLLFTDGPTIQYWGNGDEKLEMTTYDDSAKFAAEVALDKEAVDYQSGKYSLYTSLVNILIVAIVLGDRKSAKEIASAIENAYDVRVELKRLGSLEDLHAEMRAKMTEDPQNIFSWMGLNYMYHGLNGSTTLPGKLEMDNYPALKVTKLEAFLQEYELSSLATAYMF